jgi:predicted deacylase
LEVAKIGTGNTLKIPVHIINGAKEGPTLLLLAGQGGLEWAAFEWIRKLVVETKPEDLAGALVAIPVANPLTFGLGMAEPPTFIGENWRKGSIGACFPGDPDGILNERIAYVITEEVIKNVDYVIEFFLGPSFYSPACCVEIDIRAGGHLKQKIEELAKVYGLEVILSWPVIPGSVTCAAEALGIPAMNAEHWWWFRDEKIIEEHITGIRNVMTHLGMIKGKIVDKTKKKCLITQKEYPFPVIRANHSGYYYPAIGREKADAGLITQGELLGKTISPYSFEELQRFEAPYDGVCFLSRQHGPIHAGDSAYWIGDLKNVTWIKPQ